MDGWMELNSIWIKVDYSGIGNQFYLLILFGYKYLAFFFFSFFVL